MNKENTRRLKKIEDELERWLPENHDPERMDKIFPGLKKEISLASFNALFAPSRDMIFRGGKRWRPLLMALICEILGGGDSALPLAPLVEFSHNASLIHDDLEDDSDQRRGKPSIHQIYGADTAINTGSFLYFLSLCCIEYFTGENKDRIYKLWAENARRLHLGQAMDISWHRDIEFIPGVEEYYAMCGMKTGSLARLAAELGVYAAGISRDKADEAARLLGAASEKLGIGFQILDDVKNLTFNIPGKKYGDDIIEGKKSLPVILYLNKYPEKRGKIFYCLYEAKTNGASVPEIGEMTALLTNSGVLAEAEEKGTQLIHKAREFFNSGQYAGVPADNESLALLDNLIESIS